MDHSTPYDYRMYDQIWKRVSPELDPYGDISAAQAEERQCCDMSPSPPVTALSTPVQGAAAPATGEDALPGADPDPCCMGSEAAESVTVLEGFIEEELAQRRCYLGLSHRLCHSGAARLLQTMAAEKMAAAQALKASYFLITGHCYANTISIDHMRWNSLPDALRTAYHQEACNAFNYQRAAEETIDPCLQKLLSRRSQEAFERSDAVMALLSRLLC